MTQVLQGLQETIPGEKSLYNWTLCWMELGIEKRFKYNVTVENFREMRKYTGSSTW